MKFATSLLFASLASTGFAATNTLNFNYNVFGNIEDLDVIGCSNQGPEVTVGLGGTIRKQWKRSGEPDNDGPLSFDVKIVAAGGNGKHSNYATLYEELNVVSLDSAAVTFRKSPAQGGCTGNPFIMMDLNNDGTYTNFGRCTELRKENVDLTTFQGEMSTQGNVGVGFSLDCTNNGDQISLANLQVTGYIPMALRVRCQARNKKFMSDSTIQAGDVEFDSEGQVVATFNKQPSRDGVTGNPELYVQIKRSYQSWDDVQSVSLGKCIQGTSKGGRIDAALGGAIALVVLGGVGAYLRQRSKVSISPSAEEEEQTDAFEAENSIPELEVQEA